MLQPSVKTPPAKERALLAFLFVFAMAICVSGALEAGAPLYAGLPPFESLDLSAGVLTHADKKCNRSTLDVQVLSGERGARRHLLPCSHALERALAGKSGLWLEIRLRPFSSYILDEPRQDIWNVKVDGVDLYRYSTRAEHYAKGAWAAVWFNGVLAIAFLSWVLWKLLRPTVAQPARSLRDRVDVFFSPAFPWFVIVAGLLLGGFSVLVIFTLPIKPLQWGFSIFVIPAALYLVWLGCSRLSRIRHPALTLFQDRMVVNVTERIEVRYAQIAAAEIAAQGRVPCVVLALKGSARDTIAIPLSFLKSNELDLLADIRRRVAAAQ